MPLSEDAMSDDEATLETTPLDRLHRELGAKMVPFAGHAMPVQYPDGILKEHRHARAAAGLFDVSHMGQVRIPGAGAAEALERLVPGDIQGLDQGRMRYTQFTNDDAGILDDLMVTRVEDGLFLVVNASNKSSDLALLEAGLAGFAIQALAGRGLMALQGPEAAAVLARLAPEVATFPFMSAAEVTLDGVACFVTRSGYTGEDGYEISCPGEAAEGLARRLLAEPEVAPIGLGARDSLRLEAGLCLHGHDIDETTTPIEAGLAWSIGKRRREKGGFPGHEVVRRQLADGPPRRRVGILPDGRQPAREHTEITDGEGNATGEVTSGGFGPSLEGPLAMGYVRRDHAKLDTELGLVVRGKTLPARVAKMPFVAQRYYRG